MHLIYRHFYFLWFSQLRTKYWTQIHKESESLSLTRPEYLDILELWFLLFYSYCPKTRKIMSAHYCYLAKHSPHVIVSKCIFMDVWIEDMLLLWVKWYYFLPTRWQSLSSLPVALLHLSVFLFSFNHLISFWMMKTKVNSPPHRLSSVYCEDMRE